MSNILREWDLFSSKIKSLINTSNFFFNALTTNSSDPYGAAKTIHREIKETFTLIQKLKDEFNIHSPEVSGLLNEFVTENSKYIQNIDGNEKIVLTLIITLSLLESNITYLLNDTQMYIRKTVEIAFNHLQRLLIVDKNTQDLWQNVSKEPAYEKLGGTHLLLHKIWGFKVDATGERTDLVLSEPIGTASSLYPSVDGLVLTEWKVVKQQSELEKKIQSAKRQTDKYSQSSLGTTELSKARYLVMVSKDYLEIPEDINEGEIIYRIINIAYSPSSPSKHSSKTSK
ncbi:TPA: hypothetical protein ACPSKY_000709 [Legionella bozemanae]